LLLAGITATVAGALSMSLGEYLATKSQKEVYLGDLELEKAHFKYHRPREIAQLRAIMQNDLQLRGS
jgi:VIT1/CCC1 family predicted Fe2+/Mn2+ transporter